MSAMSNMVKISIIIPVYNVEDYVQKCLESVISQNYNNLEIIIVNDGSTDNSGNICEKISKLDNRIILIHQKNQGLSMARNKGIDIATGTYLGFVDGDDWIEWNMINIQYQNATKYDADISICNYDYTDNIENNDNTNKNSYKFDDDNETLIIQKGYNKIKHHINDHVVWNKLFKRNLFDDIRFPKGKEYEDIFTTYKLIDKAKSTISTSKIKYHYVIRNNSITNSHFHIGQMDAIEAYVEQCKYFSLKYPNLEQICRKNIFSSLLGHMAKAYSENCIGEYKQSLMGIINSVKKFSIDDCGLDNEQLFLMKLLFTDIKNYTIGVKILNDKKRDNSNR